jgi:recombination associated protein RdgC
VLFKQMQIFQINHSQSYFYDELIAKLQALPFQPCLPSLPISVGWAAPVEEEGAPLAEQINQRLMICMQTEERILPAAVVRQSLKEKVKQLEAANQRKLGKKEKNALKDEVVMTLLPRSFTKLSRTYAYIDIKHNWLVLGTTSKKRTEQVLALFKKTIGEAIHAIEFKKISPILTQWINHKEHPEAFAIEKKGVLQDANQKSRVIRCQHQDLFANSISELIQDGCELKQLAVVWRDSIRFVLSDDFTLRSIKFEDALIEQVKEMEAETKQQQFMADFFMMTESVSSLLEDLLSLFAKKITSPLVGEVAALAAGER